MLEKPYKTKAQTNRGMFDHAWPRKRSLNIEQMIKKMQKDRAYLFEMASHFMSVLSDMPWKLGDENISIMMGWIAAQLDSECRAIRNKRPKKVARHKR